MKDLGYVLGCSLFGVICIVVGVALIANSPSNVTTTITTSHPKDGYVCFLATTSDSVALSCIKE